MKPSSLGLLAQIICLVWDSISTGFVGDKDRRAITKLNFEVEGCRKEGSQCVLREATLQVYFRVKRSRRKARFHLQITNGDSSAQYFRTLSNSGWHDFDVRNITASWLEESSKLSKTIHVKCQDCKGKVKPVLRTNSALRKAKLIWRVEHSTVLSEPSKRRYCSQEENACCLRPKVVDVSQLHWKDWPIVIPRKLSVNECSGACDLSRTYSAHAQLLARMRSSGRTSWRFPCCVPTKLRSVSAWILEEGRFVQKNLDLIVEECGCA